MECYPIRYEFRLEGKTVSFTPRLDPTDLRLVDPPREPLPEWARLSRGRCPVCTLPEETTWCPTAAHLASVVESFATTFSFTEAEVCVTLPERTFLSRAPVQMSLSSLMGIYMVASGCPVTAPLRPMVRFHLPFASPLDTTYRAASMYLVAQFLRAHAGKAPDWELRGLSEAYQRVGEVNVAFARRLKNAAALDAHLNAIVLLDVFSKSAPAQIQQGLAELRPLFAPLLD